MCDSFSDLHGSFEGLLYIQPLSHNRGIQLPLKGQQIHVRLGLRYQVSDLKQKTMPEHMMITQSLKYYSIITLSLSMDKSTGLGKGE